MPSLPTSSRTGPSTRDLASQKDAWVGQSCRYRRSVKIDGEIVRMSESRRQIFEASPFDPMTPKYEAQLKEAMRYQMAAGDGDAVHLRTHGWRPTWGPELSGITEHVTLTTPKIEPRRGEPKVIHSRHREGENHASRSDTPKAQPMNSALLPTPPPTPRSCRLPTPELPRCEQKQFCACGACVHPTKFAWRCQGNGPSEQQAYSLE
ncbi:hypothetical protein EV356DRAFT_512859 [Viridothelium virens]|uniref:Uncharacterized protein n=1 Tax=Viridothelium virens TaxID=1048519 RepID=A0A6A6HFD1_VIRVR|nr:hypothetical protein EV356DRAFT_512859 [Viridothelium virens]